MNNFIPYIFNSFMSVVNNLSYFYKALALFLSICFLLLRTPYLYGGVGFIGLILLLISPMFGGILFLRLENGLNPFFSSLLPPGTPLAIAPFVCLAETISFVVRPLVLMLRPFLNITIGGLGGISLGMMAMGNKILVVFLCLLFLYEIFVAVVHWFIVINILGFSIDH
uniref:ATP synthase F0 subunit 6 n=1 Tax=Capsala katsuwoni TaxID=2904576 RepID=A0A8T9JE80_9PLAT|nr:ATP synthase F0 subunit 6 [Capsala katsuwoni]UOK11874.1 ATP synthase F0 subunit 6 [Capsala katsuwoni]